LKFTDVSEVLSAFITRAIALLLVLLNFYQTTVANHPGDSHMGEFVQSPVIGF
jgi:hypothetical protein